MSNLYVYFALSSSWFHFLTWRWKWTLCSTIKHKTKMVSCFTIHSVLNLIDEISLSHDNRLPNNFRNMPTIQNYLNYFPVLQSTDPLSSKFIQNRSTCQTRHIYFTKHGEANFIYKVDIYIFFFSGAPKTKSCKTLSSYAKSVCPCDRT